MAKAPAVVEMTEKEFAENINAAVAATETEIFDEAMGDEPLDNDGDNSLEETGEGLEGEHLEEEDTDSEVDTEVDPEGDEEESEEEESEDAEGEGEEGDEEGEAEGDEEQQPLAAEGDDVRGPTVPVERFKQVVRQRNEQRDNFATQLEAMNSRLDRTIEALLAGRQPADGQPAAPGAPGQTQQQQAPAPAPPPDMFADPDGYARWQNEEITRQVKAGIGEAVRTIRSDQMMTVVQRANNAFAKESEGARSWEFSEAYRQLNALDPKDPNNQATAKSIFEAPDPVAAVYDWWEQNGGQEYRDQVAQMIAEQYGVELPAAPRRGAAPPVRRGAPPQRPSQQQRGAPPPGNRRGLMRSLGDANGTYRGNNNQDPRALDGSEEAIFQYGISLTS